MIEDPEIQLISSYFPELNSDQLNQFSILKKLCQYWNRKINIISRKDLDNLIVRHVLHSLSVAKVVQLRPGSSLVDVGTGGGFPGIPLAIMFPRVDFYLIDSVAKKIKVVGEIAKEIKLKNVNSQQINSKHLKAQFNYVTGRAVTSFPAFYGSVKHLFKKSTDTDALIYLKGGDFDSEIQNFKKLIVYNLKEYFTEDFFETKKLIVLKQK